MKFTLNNIPLLMTTILLLSACSTSPLQSTRLNKAETYMIQAEHALLSKQTNNMKVAENNIGIANAYLATIKDNVKFLSKSELNRFETLKVKSKAIDARIVR